MIELPRRKPSYRLRTGGAGDRASVTAGGPIFKGIGRSQSARRSGPRNRETAACLATGAYRSRRYRAYDIHYIGICVLLAVARSGWTGGYNMERTGIGRAGCERSGTAVDCGNARIVGIVRWASACACA